MNCVCINGLYECQNCEAERKWTKLNTLEKERLLLLSFKSGDSFDVDKRDEALYFIDNYDITTSDIPKRIKDKSGIEVKQMIPDEVDYFTEILSKRSLHAIYAIVGIKLDQLKEL